MGVLTTEQMEITRLTRENREIKKYLGNVAVVIANTISALDAAMKGPSTEQRGKTVAAACNVLEHANDSLMHFALKYDFKKINKIKRQLEARLAGKKAESR